MYKFSAMAAAMVIMSAFVSAVPAQAQSIEIGPNGIQVNPDSDRRVIPDRRSERDEISERGLRGLHVAREWMKSKAFHDAEARILSEE